MGCDIHIFPEIYEDGKWQLAGEFVLDSWWWDQVEEEDDSLDPSWDYDQKVKYYQSLTEEEITAKYPREKLFMVHPFDDKHDDRNYLLFAALADVRNYLEIPIIDVPRGLPEDISSEIKKRAEFDGLDGHSHSWLTTEEIENYDWDREVIHTYYPNAQQYLNYLTDTDRVLWMPGSPFQDDIIVSVDTMKKFIMGLYGPYDEKKSYRTKLLVESTFRKDLGLRYDNGKDRIESLVNDLREYGGENQRIVFWFDN